MKPSGQSNNEQNLGKEERENSKLFFSLQKAKEQDKDTIQRKEVKAKI